MDRTKIVALQNVTVPNGMGTMRLNKGEEYEVLDLYLDDLVRGKYVEVAKAKPARKAAAK
jgi:hypothetical protein